MGPGVGEWRLNFFHDFFAYVYVFDGEGLDSAGPNSRENTVERKARIKKNLASRKCNLLLSFFRSCVQ